jgi:DNA processing protein
VILVASVAQVIEAVGRIGADLSPALSGEPDTRDELPPVDAQVLDGVRPRKLLSASEIAVAAGVSDRDARRSLPRLVRSGFVTAVGPRYRLSRRTDGAQRGGHPLSNGSDQACDQAALQTRGDSMAVEASELPSA